MSVLKKYNAQTQLWDSIVVGSTGPQGANGANGAQGAQGANGAQGAQGPQGASGATVVTSSTRPGSPFTGQIIYETDTRRIAAWTGSAWVYETAIDAPPGMVFLGGSSFSNVSSVSAPNGILSTNYRSFKIVFETTVVSTGLEVYFRYRASGSDVTAGIYRQISPGLTSGGGTANTAGDRNNFFIGAAESSADLCYASFDLHGAQYTQHKAIQGFTSWNNGSAHYGQSMIGQTNGTTASDSFTFYTNTGTISGYYYVYGYTVS